MNKISFRALGCLLAAALAVGSSGCGGSEDNGPITSTLCTDTFTACGGDPSGTWKVMGVCLDSDLAAGLNSEGPASCSSEFTGADVSASGTVMYMAPTGGFDPAVTYDAMITTKTTQSITPACASEAYGVATLDAAGCTQIQTLLKVDASTTVSCSMSAANCDCRVTTTQDKGVQNLYTIAGNTITESDNATYDFCVSGTTMTLKETLAGTVSGITRLQKM